jgi:hypothetical protein
MPEQRLSNAQLSLFSTLCSQCFSFIHIAFLYVCHSPRKLIQLSMVNLDVLEEVIKLICLQHYINRALAEQKYI